MVRMPARLRALDRKLIRDLLGMKGQAAAIAMVMAAGVTMFVAYFSNFDSLQRACAAYYERARLADVFATVTRAPASLEPRLAALPGVQRVATRVVVDVTLDVPGMAAPVTGRLISLPAQGRPALNDIHLRRGRWIDPLRPDEVLASEAFVTSHGLDVGDTIAALVNGRRRELIIVGVALSPEYVYALRAGEIFSDPRRFGVFWMDRRGLATAFDMEGAFNDVSLTLTHGASAADVIWSTDRLLERYGGRGAVPRSLQLSVWTLENELKQLQMFGFILPAIFLGVAAFVLHVALTRALALQRPQIAALKALGYSNGALAWHYVKWALLIAAGAAAAGVGIGAWLGAGLLGIYNDFFRFPALDFHLSPALVVESIAGTLLIAAVGAIVAVRRAVRVPPAEAMRPVGPGRYRRSPLEHGLTRLGFAGRMVIRNIGRQPGRAFVSTLGIALATGVLFVGLAFLDVMTALIDEQFTVAMRQHATLALVQPRSGRALHDIAHLPGVLDVEPMRVVPVRLRVGARTRTLAISGMLERPQLNRVIDRQRGPVSLPADGLLLSAMLGEILGVGVGGTIQVEVLEGRRPVLDMRVAGLVDDTLGLQAYMRIDAVHRMLREGPTISGAVLTLDPASTDAFYAAVKATPAIAGVSMRDVVVQNFRETMAETMNISIFINVLFAAVIACGVVYNAARVSLSERSRELASLRVLGFTRAEISAVLLGELSLLTLAALPLGVGIGHLFGRLILTVFTNEVYRLSFVGALPTLAWAWLTTLAAAAASALVVRHRLDHLDLIAVLKSPE